MVQRLLRTFLFVGLICHSTITAMQFDMLSQHKCIFEEINSNVIVVGEWSAFQKDNEHANQQVDLKVQTVHVAGRMRGCR